jgi:cobalt/nickel transport system permease protein
MHIPDGFLDGKVAVAMGVVAAGGLGVALRNARLHFPPRRIPLLGLAAAFVFAVQMLNFPVAGGTSAHVVGSVLVAVLLGPSAAVIVLTSVLVVQCMVFADGGITALGANIFNMGMIGAVLGWGIYYTVSRMVKGLFGRVLAASFAAWISTVLAAIVCAAELAASGTVRWSVCFPAMAGVHVIVGLGEGIATALVLVAIARTRPELLEPTVQAAPARPYGTIVAYGAVIALGLAFFISPLLELPNMPDSLDKMKDELGISGGPGWMPIPDYTMPGIPWHWLAISIAGVVGTIVVFGLAWLLARALVPKAKPENAGVATQSGGEKS